VSELKISGLIISLNSPAGCQVFAKFLLVIPNFSFQNNINTIFAFSQKAEKTIDYVFRKKKAADFAANLPLCGSSGHGAK
jgi:hypothetical protein